MILQPLYYPVLLHYYDPKEILFPSIDTKFQQINVFPSHISVVKILGVSQPRLSVT